MLAHMAPAGARPLKRAVQLSSAPEVLTCAAQSYYGSMGFAWAFSVYAVHDFSLVERVVADLIEKALEGIPAGSLPAARNNKPAGAVPAFRRKRLKGTPPSAAL